MIIISIAYPYINTKLMYIKFKHLNSMCSPNTKSFFVIINKWLTVIFVFLNAVANLGW